ncbi:hypothetical protein E18064_360258 [Elizabethkingia anophelis]|nr:hypothetical protein E18064_360258 [Elizabethkingia anophelis]
MILWCSNLHYYLNLYMFISYQIFFEELMELSVEYLFFRLLYKTKIPLEF